MNSEVLIIVYDTAGSRGVEGEFLQPLDFWDREFESR